MLDGKLYAVGGANDYLNFSSVERYDPASNAWEAVAPRWRWSDTPPA